MEKFLYLSFDWGMWIIAILQSLVFWKKPYRIPTHVRSGRSVEKVDLSAGKKGLKFVDRETAKKQAKKSQTFKIRITEAEDKKIKKMFKEYEGKKYDYFFYFRWFFNTMTVTLPFFLIASLIGGWIESLLIIAGSIYGPINIALFLLSKDRWACAEFESKLLFEALKIDFGYNRNWQGASPDDMRLKILSAASIAGRDIEELK